MTKVKLATQLKKKKKVVNCHEHLKNNNNNNNDSHESPDFFKNESNIYIIESNCLYNISAYLSLKK